METYHPQHVRLARLHRNSQVLRVVDQGGIGDRLGTSWVGDINKRGEQRLHEIMVPVGEGQDNLLVVLVLVWILGIEDDEGSAQAIGILASGVRVEPVGSRLVNLLALGIRREEMEMYRHFKTRKRRKMLTVKL